MSDLQKRKKEFLKAYNNLCSCYGELVSEQTKITFNILVEKVKLEQQLSMAVEALEKYADDNEWMDDLGYGYRNKFPEGSDIAQQALQQIKELENA